MNEGEISREVDAVEKKSLALNRLLKSSFFKA